MLDKLSKTVTKLSKETEDDSVNLNPSTKSQAALELRRCRTDPVYFAKNYVKIRHPTNKMETPFTLYPFQERVMRDFQTHRFNVILKSRQMGLTELMSTYVLWFCLFQKEKSVLIISRNRVTATELIKRIKYSYKKLPFWMKISKMITNNVFSIEFDNDSRIMAEATTSDAGRSWAGSLLVVDEAAFIPGFEETWSSIYPVLSTGGAAIVNSTPNGIGDQFYNLFTDAPKNGFNPIKLNWDLHPERNQEWFETTKSKMPPKAFAREYLCNFMVSGDTVLEGDDIEKAANGVIEPIIKTNTNHALWIWKHINHMHRYIISVDTARGDGADYSTFVVIDVDTGEIVAEYKDKVKVDRFAQILYDVGGELYRFPLLVVENNNHGLAVLMKLIDLKYPNLYWEEKGTHSYVEGFVDYDTDGVVPGFTTTMQTKMLVVAKFEEAVRLGQIKTYSSRMITEFRDFVYVLGKPKARENRNDDLVMALAIGIYVADLVFSTRTEDSAFKLSLLNKIAATDNKISTISPSEDGFDPKKNPYIVDPIDPYKVNLANGGSINFRILLNETIPQSKPKSNGIEFEIRGLIR